MNRSTLFCLMVSILVFAVSDPTLAQGNLEKIPVTERMLSASSVYSSYTPNKAFDGDMSQNSGWCALGGQKQAWLAVDFSRPRAIRRVRIFPDRWDAEHNRGDSFLDRFRIDVWEGKDWKPVSPLISTPRETWYEVTLDATTSKLRIWAESDGNSPQIKEIEVFEERNPPVKIPVTERMLSASSVYSSYSPGKAFDGDLSQNSGWCALGGQKQAWLAVDFGGPRAIRRVRIFPDRWDAEHNPRDSSFLDRFRIDVWEGKDWKPVSPLMGTPREAWYEVTLDATTSKLRIWAESDGTSPQIKEIEIFEERLIQ